MALCDATFQAVHGQCGFKLEGQVVARCHRMEHAASCEVLFSVLLHAYTTFGSGFSHHLAGALNNSAEDVSCIV